jgi:hypothetical protein
MEVFRRTACGAPFETRDRHRRNFRIGEAARYHSTRTPVGPNGIFPATQIKTDRIKREESTDRYRSSLTLSKLRFGEIPL